jgi:polygalacturonase
MLKVLLGAIACLLQLASVGQIVQAEVFPYPRVPGYRANSDFPSVKVNGVLIDTASTDMNVGFAHFAFSGTVAVEVTAKEPIRTFDLSPHRYGIQATVKGNVLSFRLSEPRKLHLEIAGLPRFFIFAEAPEANPPRPSQPGVYDIGDYGVTSSLDVVQTLKIQRAIDDVAAKKGVLYVPPGLYQSGELKMKSNLTLYLAAGAVFKGTAKVADYPRGRFGTQLIYLVDCENVRITGRGALDGRGRALRLATENASDGRLKLFRSFRAKNCVVEDVLLLDAGSWSVHLIESTDLRFTNTKLISNTILDDPAFPWEPNTDGCDPDNSSRVTIENGFVSCSDDAIAVKLRHGTLRDMDDV